MELEKTIWAVSFAGDLMFRMLIGGWIIYLISIYKEDFTAWWVIGICYILYLIYPLISLHMLTKDNT